MYKRQIRNLHKAIEDGRLALADFREVAAILKDSSARITTKIETGLDDTTANINQLSREAMPVLENLADVTANLNRVSSDLAEGQGTAGKFLRDDRLYETMVLCFRRITDLVDTIGRIANKTERQGYLDLAVHEKGPVPLPAKKKLYDPYKPTKESR